MPTRDVRLVDHWRWGGDQRGRLTTESFDKHGDGARRLVQGLVCLVGMHGAGGRCVLVASVTPSLEAVPSHLQCELSVVPLQVRGNHASAAATLGRMMSRGIVLVHAGDSSCAAGVGRLGPGMWQQHHPPPGGWWAAMDGRRLQRAQGLLLG